MVQSGPPHVDALGGLSACIGFTTPSTLLILAGAYGVFVLRGPIDEAVIRYNTDCFNSACPHTPSELDLHHSIPLPRVSVQLIPPSRMRPLTDLPRFRSITSRQGTSVKSRVRSMTAYLPLGRSIACV